MIVLFAVAEDGVDQLANDLTDRVAGMTGRATDDYVRARPWQVIAICAASGFVLGSLLARGGASDS
jgi:ElaB/YqjD/DUF883 family membrane-anchored ribosome-binding protein